ncbi:MAG TPA: peptide deformylase [Bryobacteraceae bacterium]|nr:peptide deformylase [Bryobacteraceae bacterium]
MRLKICQLGEPVLRQKAKTLSREEILGGEVQGLIEFMRETMRDAPGVGLAAPQIGLSLQIAVIEDAASYIEKMPPGQAEERGRVPVPFHVIINPKLTLRDGQPIEFFEGCLSFAGFSAIVPRARAVRVQALNEKAEPVSIDASGWYARILQHEIDHLNGVIYVDRMRSRTLMSVENHARYWKDLSTQEILDRLGGD